MSCKDFFEPWRIHRKRHTASGSPISSRSRQCSDQADDFCLIPKSTTSARNLVDLEISGGYFWTPNRWATSLGVSGEPGITKDLGSPNLQRLIGTIPACVRIWIGLDRC